MEVAVGQRTGAPGGDECKFGVVGEDREFVCNDAVSADIGECGSGTEDDGVRGDFDEAKLLEVPERDEFFGLETAGAEGDHQLGTAGDGGVVIGRVGEDLQDRVERVGGNELVLSDVGAHYSATPVRAACWTALKMRM